jgi:hypothetical protein
MLGQHDNDDVYNFFIMISEGIPELNSRIPEFQFQN